MDGFTQELLNVAWSHGSFLAWHGTFFVIGLLQLGYIASMLRQEYRGSVVRS